MDTARAIEIASAHLGSLSEKSFDVIEVKKPISPTAAVNLVKVVSKLSPLVGNLIEFNTVEFLNDKDDFSSFGEWKRQDPGFPDAILDGIIAPAPGFEIKAWFPLATEITARFKDSQDAFSDNATYVCMLAWLPEFLIYGKPVIIDVCLVSGKEVSRSRDDHYHNPPDYLVIEPNDTTQRTANLQQTNTSGYKWQGTDKKELDKANKMVAQWGNNPSEYSTSPEYQELLHKLMADFQYRLDTNFAKMDRIQNPTIEDFKQRVMQKRMHGKTIQEWSRLFASKNDELIANVLADKFNIIEEDAEDIIEDEDDIID